MGTRLRTIGDHKTMRSFYYLENGSDRVEGGGDNNMCYEHKNGICLEC